VDSEKAGELEGQTSINELLDQPVGMLGALLFAVLLMYCLLADAQAQRDGLPGKTFLPCPADKRSLGAPDFFMQLRDGVEPLCGPLSIH